MIRTVPTLLLVDDSPVNVEFLKDILRRYHLLWAYNGQDAIRLATGDPRPDLILLDVVMPGMDGYEVCQALKKMEETHDIPVVFITGQTDPDSIIKGFDAGGVDYIGKPFNIPELRARIKTQLTIKRSRDENELLIRQIEDINTKLTDSINYALKIQTASLPKSEYLKKIMPEHFILLKPRDIVSGDFYWVSRCDNKLIVVAADCTGHGVPGAIMSMFGVAYLHQIVETNKILTPSRILDELRKVIIDALQQSQASEVKDGMDMSVVCVDTQNGSFEYAGAFNPAYLIHQGQLQIIHADTMPVSIGEVDKAFTNHVVNYQHGDCLYLFSDGFASQFGGENDKKLKQKGFRQMILDNYALPMSHQKEIYEQFFERWKGDREQIDDVLLIGMRL
ncbi:MAG: response regulator [Marinilabiliaceae bacterium]|nr:response regulator [Marinilabiliaceae bacterium]